MKHSIWIGWEPREAAAFAVARRSIRRHLSRPIPDHGLVLSDLQAAGFYTRPMERRTIANRTLTYDVRSDAPMSTEHANSRFLLKYLARGWALFMDSDMLVRADLAPLFDELDPKYAVYCVKHVHNPPRGVKMDGQIQAQYARKNWSSFMVVNCEHEANQALSLEMINTLPGRDLHRLCWLDDALIGELDPAWNYLVGHSDKGIVANVVHFTSGTPDMPGYEHCEYADEWRAELRRWIG
jgi:hypothetical protein